MSYAVEVKNLVKKFKSTVAVDDISFTVGKGKIFGFLGPNGAGKTTTINILCTLLKATSGKSYINGLESSVEPEKVRQSIGIVFQDPSLDERLTAWDNLEFHGLIYNLPKKLRQERIDEVLNMVKLDDRRHDMVKTFSGGMKRRLEIARGLMHHPAVLFLDEPTLGLDPQTRNHIWQYIRKIKKEQHITIFLTTHYMEEAENCDEIAIIDHGKIIVIDTPENLKKSISKNKISLYTENNEVAVKEIKDAFGLNAHLVDGRIDVEVDDAEKFTPKLIKAIDVGIDVIQLRKPSLDDVFIELTGRTIREETLESKDLLRERGRYRVRR